VLQLVSLKADVPFQKLDDELLVPHPPEVLVLVSAVAAALAVPIESRIRSAGSSDKASPSLHEVRRDPRRDPRKERGEAKGSELFTGDGGILIEGDWMISCMMKQYHDLSSHKAHKVQEKNVPSLWESNKWEDGKQER